MSQEQVSTASESKSRYAFIWGMATGFVAAGLLTPIAIFSTLGATEPEGPSEPTVSRAAESRPEACQSFYAAGGAAADLFVERMNEGLKRGSYDADALSVLLSRVDNGTSAALTVQGLEQSSFEAYRDLARTGETIGFALIADGEEVTPESMNDFTVHLGEIKNLCTAPVE